MQWLLAAVFTVTVVWFVRREMSRLRASVDTVIARNQAWDKLGFTPDEVKQFLDGYQQVQNAISKLARKLAIADTEVANAVRVHGPLPVLDQLVSFFSALTPIE